jgi:hypothetical protein
MSNHDVPCPKCGIDARIHYHHDERTCTGPKPEPVRDRNCAHYRFSVRDAEIYEELVGGRADTLGEAIEDAKHYADLHQADGRKIWVGIEQVETVEEWKQ